VFHRRRRGLAYEGYLITEKVPDAVDLHRFVAGQGALPEAERQGRLRCRIDQVAKLVRELHRRGLSHRDLKAANILITEGNSSIWLIDLVGVRLHDRLSRRRKMQNLARLHASFFQSAALTRTDKLRFLRMYLHWGMLGRGSWKRWWREIEKATRAKVARNARSGRPLA
jgi:hypothetical protein